MDRGVAAVLMVIAGGFIALQSPINSRLGHAVGALQGAFVSFAVGTVVLFVAAALARGGLGRIGHVGEVNAIYLTGGVLGAGYVTTALVSVRSLGTGGVIAATIAGELTVAVLIDQFGWFGVQQQVITPARVLGIVLLAAGVLLVVRN
ncbi:MAG TPA: DMT family transporter [Baekduia sp.]|uniref:DMT family transporter n=1 Tax=Baekduia sp. TaxID=2600305 RepID=UPI002D7833B4|nr:DMT family transporter [Baekduia sp.]HET6509233.1 DMT family transporter [Baekduia sp.]